MRASVKKFRRKAAEGGGRNIRSCDLTSFCPAQVEGGQLKKEKTAFVL